MTRQDSLRFIGCSVLCVALVAGCYALKTRLLNLNLGMTKSEVISAMGNPSAVRGSIVNKYGQQIEVWEYELYPPPPYWTAATPTVYWLYLCDGRLAQWGQAGDWEREADRIYDVRFR